MSQLNDIFDRLFASKIPIEIIYKSQQFSVFEKLAKIHDVEQVRPPIEQLRSLFGKESSVFSSSIGTHPDFADSTTLPHHQYICSLFLDISGSTKLGLKFPLSTVRLYKNAILSTAIELFQAFDGHIHRLQGDAVFAYFGHKAMKKSDALINALSAASLMQSYNKHTLSKFFEENDLPPLRIRIGIDIGDDSEVLWSEYGIGNVTEVTSTSIHTDLAAKLQSQSPRNKIMIGENVYKYLDLSDNFFDVKTRIENGETVEDKYVLNDTNLYAYYQMRVFNWEKYLDSFSSLPKSKSKGQIYSSPTDFELICSVRQKEDEPYKRHYQSSCSLEKGMQLRFELVNYASMPIGNIKWKVVNYGTEAEQSESGLEYYMEQSEGEYVCEQSTAYTGLHFMECYIYNHNGNLIAKDKFGLFINDEIRDFRRLGVPESE
ncbi:MAG TPA: adenylate/guanylate cyclase domain-containing protein [Bacillus bacterium]|uniref:adenylate/guanylate cyclase domain-containing protein n=1 Tax=Siminovitchia fordii TaxID=254759 RepID=UPI00035D3135|nr:adenylate/guanylate cyclase domain-containing protein [Siminovitchia fordii]HBZ08804.1 adenylate/guanylate cyclase domain-containing protein [Bacillus sp. (in: firmicutes)]